ncbi:hypothetical protein [Poseidonibacter lekithochrous]|uniref:hypothetical protein n=1 Tax=Poseidonibacter lekithochrous TaxID=1904463 RepID=UPI0008FC93B3|nr:hypothetical protein [Poseidonibacter lekithochrous]QKJ24199.1 hypothetical protein ALEK_2987 [Poseidonibacter lekithochrous]
MAVEFKNEYVRGTVIDDPIVNEIYNIVYFIKTTDFNSAKQLMNQHNISFENIVSKTQTLKNQDLISFADFVINQRN